MVLVSCDVVTNEKFRSYITTYHKSNISLKTIDDKSISIETDNTVSHHYTWKSKGKDKIVFDSLSRVHNDMAYNKERKYIHSTDFGYSFYYDISSIDVVSEEDFDNNHLAGTSLNDVIHFISATPKKYIDSGYKIKGKFKKQHQKILEKYKLKDPVISIAEQEVYNIIDKKLSEIGTNEMSMLPYSYRIGVLVFDIQPTLAKTHHLTFTFHYTNGETYTAKVVKEFK